MFKFNDRKKAAQAKEDGEKVLMMEEIAFAEKENPKSEWLVFFRGVSRTLSNIIYDGAFCENSQRLKVGKQPPEVFWKKKCS